MTDGPVWMTAVSCHGNETSLLDCPHTNRIVSTCPSDAGVVCFHQGKWSINTLNLQLASPPPPPFPAYPQKKDWSMEHTHPWYLLDHVGIFPRPNWCLNSGGSMISQRGAPIPKGGANLLIGQNLPQTAWKWRKLDREGGARPKSYYVDPPLLKTVMNQDKRLLHTCLFIIWPNIVFYPFQP